MKVTIYHNPRCSKSRATLKLLEEHGYEPEIIEYLDTPPDTQTLIKLLKMLGLEPRQLLRTNENAFQEAGLSDDSLDDDAVIAAMVKYPILIERPIVVTGKRAAIGRPPENVLQILD